jgi:hypothetical protein
MLKAFKAPLAFNVPDETRVVKILVAVTFETEMFAVLTLVVASNVSVVIPNDTLASPITSNEYVGLVVPIPTFPVLATIN